MTIFVDIDETICYYENERDYNLALPLVDNIKKLINYMMKVIILSIGPLEVQ